MCEHTSVTRSAVVPAVDEVLKITLSAIKMPDLKPYTGGMFPDLLSGYTHWGWIDIDVIFGDLSPVVDAVKKYDVVTFPIPFVSASKAVVAFLQLY